jgi:trypsin
MPASIAPLALAAAARAGDLPTPPPVVNGVETADFPAVGVLIGVDPASGRGGPFCSGTVVGRTWVVTAAHCVDAALEYVEDFGIEVYFAVGTDVFAEGGLVASTAVTAMEMHPDYTGRDIVADVGLVALEEPLPVDPVALSDQGAWPGWDGASVTVVGWGITADGAEDAGIKRTAELTVFSWDDDFLYLSDAESNLCSGDSGGAALMPDGDGTLRLAGVNSFVFALDGGGPCVGGGSGVARVDTYLPWITEVTGISADYAGSGGPEDPTLSLDGDGGGGSGAAGMADESGKSNCAAAPHAPSAALGLLAGLAFLRRRRRAC